MSYGTHNVTVSAAPMEKERIYTYRLRITGLFVTAALLVFSVLFDHWPSNITTETENIETEEVSATTSALNAAPLALQGIDLVAYFDPDLNQTSLPLYGSSKHKYVLETLDGWNSSIKFRYEFRFTTAEHRESFIAAPHKYLPKYGGFCSYGITNEFAGDKTMGMDEAGAAGWPWERNYLGPPGNPAAWTLYKGDLYFAFFSTVIETFEEDIDANIARGDARWNEWFGGDKLSSGGDEPAVTRYGPVNSECLASGYGPPVSRTCTLDPQLNEGIELGAVPFDRTCRIAIDKVCGLKQGNDPVSNSGSDCTDCLTNNFDTLKESCTKVSTETALFATVDKAYCF
uniref:Uncharacterized protein n=1 Tax=Octactis speculum TaxID=3111310 RepID=A0A7S2E359_9STRA|mmetsp:Transcript_57953/g.78990  ORF Transcript_57953/g.78990 Transcript_57953/m.78990 type:complete len:343 (+) Transcript_57953:60-1088(+)